MKDKEIRKKSLRLVTHYWKSGRVNTEMIGDGGMNGEDLMHMVFATMMTLAKHGGYSMTHIAKDILAASEDYDKEHPEGVHVHDR